MIACVGDPETVREIAAGHDRVALAAVNAPRNLVFSGAADRIAALRGDLERKGVTVRPLAVSHAFHSPLMAGAAEPLLEAARAVEFQPPAIPWISDATGEPVTRVDAEYWVRHLLGTVRFADGFARLRAGNAEGGLGCDAFVEIGPHPTLLNLGRSAVADGPEPDGRRTLWLPSLRRGAPAAAPCCGRWAATSARAETSTGPPWTTNTRPPGSRCRTRPSNAGPTGSRPPLPIRKAIPCRPSPRCRAPPRRAPRARSPAPCSTPSPASADSPWPTCRCTPGSASSWDSTP